MTAPAKTASNGSKPPAPAPERLSGLAYVLEAEAWHNASVAHSAAFEADRLCDDIYRAVSDAYQPQGGSHAADLAASEPIQVKAREAVRCLHAAVNYLNDLIGADEPPF